MPSDRDARADRLLSIVQAWLPVLTVVVGAVWGLYQYLDHAREAARAAAAQDQRDAANRTIEARKPFLEKQLALYFETAQVVGKLVTITPDVTEWAGLERRFRELYWSELAMVEDRKVEAAMVAYGTNLSDYVASFKSVAARQPEKLEELKRPLYNASLDLAHAIRASIEQEWGGGKPLGGDGAK